MPIRFPSMHLAASVRNQILDVWEDVAAGQDAGAAPSVLPNAPDTSAAEAQLQEAGAVAGQEATAPPPQSVAEPQPDLVGSIASGTDLIEEAL